MGDHRLDSTPTMLGKRTLPLHALRPPISGLRPGRNQRLKGWFSFYQGVDIVGELQRLQELGWDR